MLTDDQLLRALRDRFGHPSFRPGQLEVLRAVLEGRPTLAIMPTGAGKSLCYQLPSLALDGVTLVVSPLVALMKDQVDALSHRGIPAAYVNSLQSEEERQRVEAELARGRLKLVFVAPERFRSASFRESLSRTALALTAIDEAHCVSEWGHSFRPDYARLGEALDALQSPRRLALTATASPDVRADILRVLRFRNALVAVAGFDRPNIHLDVHSLSTEPEKRDSLLAAVRAHHPAIAYSATRRQALQLAKFLAQHGVAAAPYHGGLDPQERSRVQEAFARDRLEVVAATNAFGLGIDKPNVRLVVHTEVPRSLEAYYQELGRAGRDGLPAVAALFFAAKDLFLQRALMRQASPRPQVVLELWRALVSSGRPLTREELGRLVHPRGREILASLAYLEGIGAVERRGRPAAVRLEVSTEVDPEGESAAAAVVRLLGGRRGLVLESRLMASLGCPTPQALYAELVRLRARRQLGWREVRSQSAYRPRDGGALSEEHLRALRIRLSRDHSRFEQMIELARGQECRRRALLRALGEPHDSTSCGACDVCAGHRIEPVRSQLSLARASARPAATRVDDARQLLLTSRDLERVTPADGPATSKDATAPSGAKEKSWQVQ